jgi:MraZ protein
MSVTDPKARLLRRLIFSTADHVDLDKAGRILIAQFLRQSANLDRDVVVVGSGDYIEIWSPENWDLQVHQLQDTETNAERFAALNLPADQPFGGSQNA